MSVGLARDCIFWGNEQMLEFACGSDAAEALSADSMPGRGSVRPPAERELGAAAAWAATAVAGLPSLAPGRAVRGVGVASGMLVFSGNHVRSNQHIGSVPVDAEGLRLKVGRGPAECPVCSVVQNAQPINEHLAQAKPSIIICR
jgi:hypothetical protein